MSNECQPAISDIRPLSNIVVISITCLGLPISIFFSDHLYVHVFLNQWLFLAYDNEHPLQLNHRNFSILIRRINNNAYVIDLPEELNMSNIFNISDMRKYYI